MQVGSSSPSVPASSLQGLQRAFDRNAARAQRLSNPDGDSDLVQDMAQLPSDKQDVTVQTKVIKTQDQMLGDLLDILA